MIFQLPHQKHLAIKAIETAKEGYFCEVAKKKKPRSNQQNRYFHGIVVKIISQESGYTENETKQILANEFLTYDKNGKEFTKSTTELNTTEFEDYMTKCRILASEQGWYIPLPNECTEDMYRQLENFRL